MDILPNFYNNLFGIEITALGIITAATFVFLQILYANYSHRDMSLFLQRKSIPVYVLLSFVLVLFTGLGSLLLTLGTYDFVPLFNFHTRAIYQSNFSALGILVALLTSAILGIYTIYESIRLLNPSALIRGYLNKISIESVTKFLYNKYGVPAPFPHVTIMTVLQDSKEAVESKVVEQKTRKDAEDKYEKDKKEYDRLKRETEGAPDVFEGFTNIVTKTIANADVSTVRGAISDYGLTIKKLLVTADASFPFILFARNSADILTFFLEACRRHNLQSLSPEFVRVSREVALAFFRKPAPESVKEILKSWKDQADIAIQTSDRPLFREIMQGYEEVANLALEEQKKKPEEKEDVLDESFRNLGWLAERLLTKKGLEARPIMYDNDYNDEFDALYNTLFHFEWKYNSDDPAAYPLIFFDAVQVLFDRLLAIYKNSQAEGQGSVVNGGAVKDRLFDCAYVYASFAREALRASNSGGVALSSMRLKQVYDSAVESGAEEVALEIIDLIVGTAILVAINSDKMKKETFLGDPVEKYLEKAILSSPYRDRIRKAVFESYKKFDEGPHDAKNPYIKSLGRQLHDNFGLNFDPATGQDYAANDPRCR